MSYTIEAKYQARVQLEPEDYKGLAEFLTSIPENKNVYLSVFIPKDEQKDAHALFVYPGAAPGNDGAFIIHLVEKE